MKIVDSQSHLLFYRTLIIKKGTWNAEAAVPKMKLSGKLCRSNFKELIVYANNEMIEKMMKKLDPLAIVFFFSLALSLFFFVGGVFEIPKWLMIRFTHMLFLI